MRAFSYLGLFATLSIVATRSPQHVGKRLPKPAARIEPRTERGFASKESVERVGLMHLSPQSKSCYYLSFDIGSQLTTS